MKKTETKTAGQAKILGFAAALAAQKAAKDQKAAKFEALWLKGEVAAIVG